MKQVQLTYEGRKITLQKITELTWKETDESYWSHSFERLYVRKRKSEWWWQLVGCFTYWDKKLTIAQAKKLKGK